MPTLHLDDVPEELYRRIERLAAAEQVPLTLEAVRLLQEAVTCRTEAEPLADRSQAEILDWIIRHRFVPATGIPDSVELLREDRSR
jgi:hypothetical protein